VSIDLNARMPSCSYREKVLELRKLIATSKQADFSLYLENTGDATSAQVNETVVRQYMKQIQRQLQMGMN
jgi:hypothetical protein